MAAIAHKPLSKSRGRRQGLVRSPEVGVRVTSPAAPLMAAERPPNESIRAIPRLV